MFLLLSQILDFALWTKAQWSNSQKANFIEFKHVPFWDPYMCTFHFQIQVLIHEGQTPPGPNRDCKEFSNIKCITPFN